MRHPKISTCDANARHWLCESTLLFICPLLLITLVYIMTLPSHAAPVPMQYFFGNAMASLRGFTAGGEGGTFNPMYQSASPPNSPLPPTSDDSSVIRNTRVSRTSSSGSGGDVLWNPSSHSLSRRHHSLRQASAQPGPFIQEPNIYTRTHDSHLTTANNPNLDSNHHFRNDGDFGYQDNDMHSGPQPVPLLQNPLFDQMNPPLFNPNPTPPSLDLLSLGHEHSIPTAHLPSRVFPSSSVPKSALSTALESAASVASTRLATAPFTAAMINPSKAHSLGVTTPPPPAVTRRTSNPIDIFSSLVHETAEPTTSRPEFQPAHGLGIPTAKISRQQTTYAKQYFSQSNAGFLQSAVDLSMGMMDSPSASLASRSVDQVLSSQPSASLVRSAADDESTLQLSPEFAEDNILQMHHSTDSSNEARPLLEQSMSLDPPEVQEYVYHHRLLDDTAEAIVQSTATPDYRDEPTALAGGSTSRGNESPMYASTVMSGEGWHVNGMSEQSLFSTGTSVNTRRSFPLSDPSHDEIPMFTYPGADPMLSGSTSEDEAENGTKLSRSYSPLLLSASIRDIALLQSHSNQPKVGNSLPAGDHSLASGSVQYAPSFSSESARMKPRYRQSGFVIGAGAAEERNSGINALSTVPPVVVEVNVKNSNPASVDADEVDDDDYQAIADPLKIYEGTLVNFRLLLERVNDLLEKYGKDKLLLQNEIKIVQSIQEANERDSVKLAHRFERYNQARKQIRRARRVNQEGHEGRERIPAVILPDLNLDIDSREEAEIYARLQEMLKLEAQLVDRHEVALRNSGSRPSPESTGSHRSSSGVLMTNEAKFVQPVIPNILPTPSSRSGYEKGKTIWDNVKGISNGLSAGVSAAAKVSGLFGWKRSPLGFAGMLQAPPASTPGAVRQSSSSTSAASPSKSHRKSSFSRKSSSKLMTPLPGVPEASPSTFEFRVGKAPVNDSPSLLSGKPQTVSVSPASSFGPSAIAIVDPWNAGNEERGSNEYRRASDEWTMV